jgi:hypothetical protein
MTWEQPTALWLLLAILLLLFARRTPPRQRLAVAHFFLWAELESRKASVLSHRLRRHWLLILQAAFVAVLVIALARPLVSLGSQHVAIVIDVSMSMGARDGSTTRLEAAKARAVSLVSGLPRGSHARIWLAGASVDVLGEFTRSSAALERALQPVRPSDTGADLDVAIERARTADPAASRIYVLSDMAPQHGAQDVAWLTVGGPAGNASITTLEARRDLDDGTVALLVSGRNYSAASMSADVVITNEASVVARRTLDLPAGGGLSVVFELPDLEGVVVARLEASDALLADNVRFTVLPPAQPLRARLIGRNHFVEQALAAHPGVVTTGEGALLEGEDDEPDLVICAGCQEPPLVHPRVGVLLLAPSAASPRPPSALVVTNGAHPLLRRLSADGAMVAPINGGPLLDSSAVLAHAATLPVIVARESDGRRIVEFRFDPAASDVTGEVTFPLLVFNAIDWLVAPRRAAVLVAGEPFQRFANDVDGNAIVVTGPDDRVIPMRRAGADLIVADTALAGIYRVTSDNRDVEFVVNPAVERESDLSVAPSGETSTPSTTLDERTSPTGITSGLLIAALALLALEWRHRTGKRGR